MIRTYYTRAALDLIESKNIEWVHLSIGTAIPPILDGSFNHLIWDILNMRQGQDLLISSYFADAFQEAQTCNQSIVYLESIKKKRLERILHRVKLRLKRPASVNQYLEEAASIISQSGCTKVLLWAHFDGLPQLRLLLPHHTIAFAQRHYDYPSIAKFPPYDNCDVLIAQTRGQIRFAFEHWHRLTPFAISIPNGVRLEVFSPAVLGQREQLRSKFNIPQTSFVVIVPSKLVSHKGSQYLLRWIDAFADRDTDIFFLVVGKLHQTLSANHRLELEKVLSTRPNVKWVGGVSRSEMPDYYRLADICLMPGLWREGFSMSAIEALASGLPLVATKAGFYVETIRDEYNGILCRIEYLFQDVIDAVSRLKNNPDLCKRMSMNARYYAEKRLSREKQLSNFNAALENRFEDIDDDLSIPND